jgi:hypothetical protein
LFKLSAQSSIIPKGKKQLKEKEEEEGLEGLKLIKVPQPKRTKHFKPGTMESLKKVIFPFSFSLLSSGRLISLSVIWFIFCLILFYLRRESAALVLDLEESGVWNGGVWGDDCMQRSFEKLI